MEKNKKLPVYLMLIQLCLLCAINIMASDPVSRIFVIEYIGKTVNVNTSQEFPGCFKIFSKDSTGDLHFRYDSISSDYGITCDDEQANRIIKALPLDISYEQAPLYMDFLFRNNAIMAPENGYATSVPAGKKVYFIKSVDGNYGAIVKFDEYMGDIERYYYYLVIAENSRKLHKDEVLTIPAELKFTVDIFSGRPNPVFTLKDKANIRELIYSLYSATDYTGDKSLLINESVSHGNNLGFRSFVFDNPLNVCSILSHRLLYSIGNGIINIQDAGTPERKWISLMDRDTMLQKRIIKLAFTENPSYKDSVGTLCFRDLFSDTGNMQKINKNKQDWFLLGSIDPPESGIKDFLYCSEIAQSKNENEDIVFIAGKSGIYGKIIKSKEIDVKAEPDFVKLNDLGNIEITCVLKTENKLYLGSRDEGVIYRRNDSTNWVQDNEGLPSSTVGKMKSVSYLSREGSTLFAVVTENQEVIYCKDSGAAVWTDALLKYNVNLSTSVNNLQNDIPFEVRKFLLEHSYLKAKDDSTYVVVTMDSAKVVSDWEISNISRSGPAILAYVNSTCRFCSDTKRTYGVVLKSTDNGKTFKVVIMRNGMPRIHLVSSENKAFCYIKTYYPLDNTDTSKWSSGIYLSEDYGTTWEKMDSMMLPEAVTFLNYTENCLVAATSSGSVYMKYVGDIHETSGMIKTGSPVKYVMKRLPVNFGSRKTYISIPMNAKNVNLILSDLQGKILAKKQFSGESTLIKADSRISAGVYLVKVTAGEYRKTGLLLLK